MALQGIVAPEREGMTVQEEYRVVHSIQIGAGFADYYLVNGERWVRLIAGGEEASAPVADQGLERVTYSMQHLFGCDKNHLHIMIIFNAPTKF